MIEEQKLSSKIRKVTRLWRVGEEITFLRNLIKIGRFTFRLQKFNSVFSLARERDFVISLISSCCLKTFLRLVFSEQWWKKISSKFYRATSWRDSWALHVSILLWLLRIGLRVILGCLTSLLPPSLCSNVKTILSSTDWSVRWFVCV